MTEIWKTGVVLKVAERWMSSRHNLKKTGPLGSIVLESCVYLSHWKDEVPLIEVGKATGNSGLLEIRRSYGGHVRN